LFAANVVNLAVEINYFDNEKESITMFSYIFYGFFLYGIK